jgi:GNAT superfamily N-acetyltransferase
MTADAWLARRGAHPPRAQERTFVAETRGVVVGFVQAWLDWWTPMPGACVAIVRVAEQQRGVGIGSELWHAARRHLLAVGGGLCGAYFEWTEDGERWARRRGFTPARYETLLAVDPRTVRGVAAVDGFRAVPLGEVAPEDVHAVEEAAGEPSSVPLSHRYDEWLESVWKNADLDAGTAVLAGDRVVAISFLRLDSATRRGANGLTAVLPEHRGRGLAALAKTRSLRYAAEHAIVEVVASNDDANAPMLAVNRRLGYAPVGRRVEMLGDIATC